MNILHKAAYGHLKEEKQRKEDKKAKDEARKSVSTAAGGKSPKPEAPKAADLLIEMESPPLVMYGAAVASTGALMSGQFKLKVTAPEVRLDTLELKLVIEQSNKKPVEKSCAECTVKQTVLRRWRLISEPTTYKQGSHQFPFSFLLQGHLPASTQTPLGSISYVLYGSAVPVPRQGSNPSGSASAVRPNTPPSHNLFVSHVLPVYRALPPPESDRTAIRVFPPTNLQAICTLPTMIHPITSGFPVLLRLNGVAEHADAGKTVRNWRLKKLTWRLEELTKLVSAACDKHATKIGGRGKGISQEETHNLGGRELREGWKSDYTPPGAGAKGASGSIEMELICGPKPRSANDPRPACDVETPSGFSVQHKLVIECVVTEEMHPTDKPKWVAPTGVARILRMGFEIKVTERMGLGISWDEEQPPTYEDVPASPPGYIDERRLGYPALSAAVNIPDRRGSRPEIESWEEPPSYADNRMGIADDEDWNVSRVDLSEGVRPHGGPHSGDRSEGDMLATNGAGEGPSGMRGPNVRPARLDASDFETDPYEDMMRGRQRNDDEGQAAYRDD